MEVNCKHHFQTYSSRKVNEKFIRIRSKHPIILDLFVVFILLYIQIELMKITVQFKVAAIILIMQYKVKFENNEEMEIDISYSSFNNQYLNAVKLHYIQFG